MSKYPLNKLPAREARLLRNYDRAARAATPFLVDRYGEGSAAAFVSEGRSELIDLFPRVPYLKGHTPALNVFMGYGALEIAFYKAMKKRGYEPGEAWEVCHHAIAERLKAVPRFVRWLLLKLMYSRWVRKRAARIALLTQKNPIGSFAFNYVEGDGGDADGDADAKNFDWGVDYTGCSILKMARDEGVPEFAPYICLSDIALSDALGWGLIRTETLAQGFDRCDFRFKKGGATKVRSIVKGPGVWNGD